MYSGHFFLVFLSRIASYKEKKVTWRHRFATALSLAIKPRWQLVGDSIKFFLKIRFLILS